MHVYSSLLSSAAVDFFNKVETGPLAKLSSLEPVDYSAARKGYRPITELS